MKFRLLLTISSLSLLTLLAMPVRVVAQEAQQQKKEHPQRYTVTDLGPVGNPFSQATSVNNPGLVTGLDTTPDGTQHAVLWYEGLFTDIGAPALGGPTAERAASTNSAKSLVGPKLPIRIQTMKTSAVTVPGSNVWHSCGKTA